jgi:aminopeptidase YwaD
MPPTFAVPYLEAWRWRRDELGRVRLAATVDLRRARSQNVIGEMPGEDPRLPALVVTAHHDTQAGNTGADDNASGVVALLELARVLAPAPRARTVRFISFGAEEQLSVGAAAYLRRHRAAVPRTSGLVVNFDSVASPLGHFEMWCVGEDALEKAARRAFAREGLDVVPRREVTPFVDNFPFNRAGVPSLWFMRANFPGGRWQHHSPHDSLKHVSVPELVRLLRGVTPFVQRLAASPRWPFAATVPADQRREARRVSRALFGV